MCLKAEFAIVVAVLILSHVIKLITILFHRSNKPMYFYASTNAVVAGMFFACFAFMLFLSLTGFPSEPIEVQLDNTNVIIGEQEKIQTV